MERKAIEEIDTEKSKLRQPTAEGMKKLIKATSILNLKPETSIQHESDRIIAAAITTREARNYNYEPAARHYVLDENYDDDEDDDGDVVDEGMVEDGGATGSGEKVKEFEMVSVAVQSSESPEETGVD